ncbi:NUMOD4 motif-containing HNH endonuclease [Microbacterium sp. NPDC089190]|uniref:NUMOD4 motif-containing HNH endonuclease n=1 Tax=Microbacterium sp. NPDC089190 TaxID=3155063 RepID=UPI0034504F32
MNSTERWLPVPGWDGLYEVSDEGRVRSLARVVMRRNGVALRVRSRDLVASPEPNGHLQVSLKSPGVRSQRRIHQLVLEAFVGPRPPGHETCHNDGDPSNNRLENLRWDTQSENTRDRVVHGTHNESSKSVCPRGHLLTAPNLTRHHAANGVRSCLACARTWALVRRRGGRFDVDLADAKYLEIMTALHLRT